jgi:hypothetical protein
VSTADHDDSAIDVSLPSVVVGLRSPLKAVKQTSERGAVRNIQLGECVPQVRANCPDADPETSADDIVAGTRCDS